MTRIYLVRHGQTQWNKEEIFRGTTDVPLNESGLKEARLAAEALREEPIKAVYTSPLARANQTAEAIARIHRMEARVIDDLRDICFGEWQGVAHKILTYVPPVRGVVLGLSPKPRGLSL